MNKEQRQRMLYDRYKLQTGESPFSKEGFTKSCFLDWLITQPLESIPIVDIHKEYGKKNCFASPVDFAIDGKEMFQRCRNELVII